MHKILVVIKPLLIDEDYYARIEGCEIISNLSKVASLAYMISTVRPDIDHTDEYVYNTTAHIFSVVASALGIPSLLPFLRAVCCSKNVMAGASHRYSDRSTDCYHDEPCRAMKPRGLYCPWTHGRAAENADHDGPWSHCLRQSFGSLQYRVIQQGPQIPLAR